MSEGSFVVVIGTNGSGKSTLLTAVAGGFSLDSGRDTRRRQCHGGAEHRRASMIGHVFQNPFSGTAPSMSIAENLALAARRGRRRGLGWALRRSVLRELQGTGEAAEHAARRPSRQPHRDVVRWSTSSTPDGLRHGGRKKGALDVDHRTTSRWGCRGALRAPCSVAGRGPESPAASNGAKPSPDLSRRHAVRPAPGSRQSTSTGAVPLNGFWKTRGQSADARRCSGQRVMSTPSSVIRPVSSKKPPATAFSSVDLPEPFVPMTMTNEPSSIEQIDAVKRAHLVWRVRR